MESVSGILKKAWIEFKSQPEIWFFYGFLVTSMLSVRKILFFYPIDGQFNEYASASIYLSDLFLITTLVAGIFSILSNRICNLSIATGQSRLAWIKCSTPVQMFHPSTNVPRGTFCGASVEHSAGQAWNISKRQIGLGVLLLLLVVWAFISISWSIKPEIAWFRSFKLFEMVALLGFLVLNRNCSTWNNLRNFFGIIIFVGIINSVIGVSQVLLQHSVGLFWLKESVISANISGVAKVILHGDKYVRAYGLFPHPNVLGGFLVLSIVTTWAYWKMFFRKEIVPRGTIPNVDNKRAALSGLLNCSTWNKFPKLQWKRYINVPRGTFMGLLLLIQVAGIVVTFSKSAYVGLLSTILFIYVRKNVPRGTLIAKLREYIAKIKCSTWNKFDIEGSAWAGKLVKSLFHVEQIRKSTRRKRLIVVLFGLLLVSILYLGYSNKAGFVDRSVDDRIFYLGVAKNMIVMNPLTGTGMGQFVLTMPMYNSEMLLDWQHQPVHNVFLLIWSELGLVGLGIFIWFLWKLFHVEQFGVANEAKIVPRGTIEFGYNIGIAFKALIVGFLVIALFDHYLWDIQQGQIMLLMVLGILAANQSIDK
jgi:hypothetical protein